MFTGIIQAIGEVRAVESIGGDARLRIGVGDLRLEKLALGDSIAVSGVCLTAVALSCRCCVTARRANSKSLTKTGKTWSSVLASVA